MCLNDKLKAELLLSVSCSAVIPVEVLRVPGFFSSPGLLSVFEAGTQMVSVRSLIRATCVNKVIKDVCVCT